MINQLTINQLCVVSQTTVITELLSKVLELNILTTVITETGDHGNIHILHLLSINTSDSGYLGVVRDRNVDIRVLGVLLWRCCGVI